MPTVLQSHGWRFFFYANEGDEPMHIHAEKSGIKCKFWRRSESYTVELAEANGLGPEELRQIRKLVYLNFEQIEAAWRDFDQRKL